MESKKKKLPKKTIHLWYCDIKKNRNKIKSYYSLLDKDEKERNSRFKFDKDRECYVISRGILRLLLEQYLEIDAKEIRFNYSPFGKPFLNSKNDLRFNISHSGNRAAFALFKNQEIGVDIEKIKDDFVVLDLAQNFFSKTEIESLEKLPKKELPRAFFRCWTRKESFIKAEGSGLSFPLNQFAVSLGHDNKAELLATAWDSNEKSKWSLFSFVPAEGYLAACAVQSKVKKIKYFDWDTIKSQ